MSCRSKASGSAAGQEQGRHSSGGKILRKAVQPVTKQGMAAAGWGNPSREHSLSLPRAVPSRAVPAPRLQRAQRPRRSRPGEPPPPPSPPVPPKSLHTCALPGTFWGKKAFFWFRLVGLLKRFAVRSDRAGCVCCATAAGAERVGEAVGSWASSVSKYGSAAPGQQPSPRPDFLALTSPSVQVSAGSCLGMTLNRRLLPCPHRTRTSFLLFVGTRCLPHVIPLSMQGRALEPLNIWRATPVGSWCPLSAKKPLVGTMLVLSHHCAPCCRAEGEERCPPVPQGAGHQGALLWRASCKAGAGKGGGKTLPNRKACRQDKGCCRML